MARSRPQRAHDGRPSPELPFATLYAALVESADDAIFTKRLDGTITSWNAGAERLYGYSSEDVIGRPVTMLATDDQAAEIVVMLERLAAGDRIANVETIRRHRDGSPIRVSLTISPIRDDEGRIVGASTVARDIGERFAQEARLLAAEARFRSVIDSSPNAWIGVDRQGIVEYANAQLGPTFGYDPGEVVGQPVETLIPERYWSQHVRDRRRFVEAPIPRAMGKGRDLMGRRKDGSEFPVEISLSGAADGDLIFASVVDITTRKSLEAQLLQAQKLESIGRLAGGIAHDFNNMLYAIRGFSELLQEDLAQDEGQPFDRAAAGRSVNAISNAADRASALTGQLLAFSRQQVVSPSIVDVNAAVESVEPMLRRLIGENIRLNIDLDKPGGNIRADAGQLGQIFVNLVVNARDALPDGGAITIQTSKATFDEPYASEHFDVVPGSYVVIAVSDNGIGMDRETTAHIFEPFFTTKALGKGTGLGLATIYGIVRQAGGYIWLYSEPGQGSTFKVYFPRVEEMPRSQATSEPQVAPGGAGTILVVEDEPAVQEITTRLLERAGYQVIPAGDGDSALKVLAESGGQIQALVSDVIMPGMSGLELAERVLDDHPTVGIVLVSGYLADTLDLDRLIARGAVFAAKPATSQVLLSAVQRAIVARGD